MIYDCWRTSKSKEQIKPLQQVKYIKTEKLFLLFYTPEPTRTRRKETPKIRTKSGSQNVFKNHSKNMLKIDVKN
jgi:hypothetical protein